MRIQRRGWRAGARLTSLALISGTILATAPAALAAAYTYDCDTGSMPSSQYHMYVHKETANSTDEFEGAIGEAFARDRATCYGASASKSGFSAVFPANLQQNLNGGGLVQVGFYEDSSMNNTVMVYTPWDHGVSGQCGGQPGCIAVANWYNNGAAVCTTCVYRFRIAYVFAQTAEFWEVCIRNVSNAQAYVCTNVDYTWGGATKAKIAWWLYETKNSADAIGHTATGNISPRWLQYRRENSTTWMVRSGMGNEPAPYDYNAQGGCRHDPVPSHYKCAIKNVVDLNGDGSLNDGDSLEAWTTLH